MKGWLAVSALALLTVAGTVSANISVTDGSSTSFDVRGEIQPECKVANQSSNQATQLNLQSQEAQAAGSVAIWCNTGQDTASATYNSDNDGYLVNDNGSRIAYNLSIESNNSDLNLNSPQTIQQQTGAGFEGDAVSRQLSVLPQVTGFESAGNYRDTIQVTVSYN